jgi:hypothetical protein
MLQVSMEEMIGQAGFVELCRKPRLVETVRAGITEGGIRLRLPNIDRGGAP